MNRLAEKYRDRGLVIIALQVRRDPDVLAENIIYWLQRIRPTFPVFRRGWNPEWPTRTLPWTILFDHEGNEVYAGKPERVEPVVVKTLDAAPDHVIGGPYTEQKALAAKIIADRAGIGGHLAQLRAMKKPGPEVAAMIASAERWFARQAARIDEDMRGVVEQAEGWDALAREFAGDTLGDRAAKERDALRAAKTFAAEQASETALRRARATMRDCPPRGGYFPYHFTRENYTVIKDPVWVATRVRMLTEFRIELGRIAAAHPKTRAGEEAAELMCLHDTPEVTAKAARERIARAERLMKSPGRPTVLYEAWLLLVEAAEGCIESEETAARAAELLAGLQKDRAKDLAAARTEVRTLREEMHRLQQEVLRGGMLLPRKKADEAMARLNELAKRAGSESLLARRIASYVAELTRSFQGRPLVGVRLDDRFAGPGTLIARVDPGTGAAKAGLKPGDVILKFGGTTLASFTDFMKALGGLAPGEVVKLQVKRSGGEIEDLELTLGRRPRRR